MDAEKEMATADGLGLELKRELESIKKEVQVDVRDPDGHPISLGDWVHDPEYTLSAEIGWGKVAQFDEYEDGAVWMLVEFKNGEDEEYLLTFNELEGFYETELESA